MKRGLTLLALCWLGGCFRADLSEDLARADTEMDAGTSGSDRDRDAALPDSAVEDDGDAQASHVRHPQCAPEIGVNPVLGPSDFEASDAAVLELDGGRFEDNAWSQLACDKLPALVACDADNRCPLGASCIRLTPDVPGYCAASALEGESAPGAASLTYRDGACALRVAPEVKAALCCADAPGVDCRPWPSEEKSSLGEMCRARSDCELGLLCAPRGEWFGACACPGESRGEVVNLPDCSRDPALHPGALGDDRVTLPHLET